MQNKPRPYSWRCLPTRYPPPLPPGAPEGLPTTPCPHPCPMQQSRASHPSVGGATGPTKQHRGCVKGNIIIMPQVQHEAAWGCRQQCFGSRPPMKLQFSLLLMERSRETPRITQGDDHSHSRCGCSSVRPPRAALQLSVRVPWERAVI